MKGGITHRFQYMTQKYTKSRGPQRKYYTNNKEKKVVRTFSHIIGYCVTAHVSLSDNRFFFFRSISLPTSVPKCPQQSWRYCCIYILNKTKENSSEKATVFPFLSLFQCVEREKKYLANSSRRRSRVVNSCSRCGKCY